MPKYLEMKQHSSESLMDQIRIQKGKLKTIWPDGKNVQPIIIQLKQCLKAIYLFKHLCWKKRF